MAEVPARPRPGACTLLAVTLLGGGCTTQALQRFAYDVGDQYACQASNESRIDEQVRDVRCADPARERVNFEDYQAARSGDAQAAQP